MGRLTSITSATLPALLRDVRAGTDVLATGDGSGAPLLDAAAEALGGECRIVRVAPGPGPLSLSGLMAQVAGNTDLTAQDDSVVELGFRRLAVPDVPGQRIALLVSDAGQLQRAALRFIQHVARNAPALVLVLAGGPELDALLNEADFAPLRARLPAAAADAPPPVRERVSSVSNRTRRSPLWAAGGLGLAASVALAAWAVRAPTVAPEPLAPLAVEQARAVPLSPAAVLVPKQAEAAAKPSPAPAAEPVTQQAMLVPPASPAPQPAAAAAEPDRLPTPPRPPKQADTRPREQSTQQSTQQPIPGTVRRAHASRPAVRGPEPEHGYWADETPRPVYGGPAPPYWARPGYDAWMAPPPPPERPYIGTFTADRSGMRSFHFDGGRYEGGWR